jgi:hypothetical protein
VGPTRSTRDRILYSNMWVVPTLYFKRVA